MGIRVDRLRIGAGDPPSSILAGSYRFHADLPTPSTGNIDKVYQVREPSGTWFSGKKAGNWRLNSGLNYVRLGVMDGLLRGQDVVNNLNSSSATLPLAANQGLLMDSRINSAGLPLLEQVLQARLSSSIYVSGVSKISFNTIEANLSTTGTYNYYPSFVSQGGFYVPAGYLVELSGFAKSYNSAKFITFRWYRNTTVIQGIYGGDTTSNDTDSNTGSGVEAKAWYHNTANAFFYLYRAGGLSNYIYHGNSNIASSYIQIKLYRM